MQSIENESHPLPAINVTKVPDGWTPVGRALKR